MTNILTLILLIISETLGLAPVDINGIIDALIQVYLNVRRKHKVDSGNDHQDGGRDSS